jgi:hypothetical protein
MHDAQPKIKKINVSEGRQAALLNTLEIACWWKKGPSFVVLG